MKPFVVTILDEGLCNWLEKQPSLPEPNKNPIEALEANGVKEDKGFGGSGYVKTEFDTIGECNAFVSGLLAPSGPDWLYWIVYTPPVKTIDVKVYSEDDNFEATITNATYKGTPFSFAVG